MSASVNATKNDEHSKKKKKYSLIKDECDPEYSYSKVKRLKKKKSLEKISNDFVSQNQSSNKYLQYKNTYNYTSVVANPESLQAVPKIFKTNKFKNRSNDSSDSFLYNVISMSSFNTDVHQRFNHMGLICPNVFDWSNPAAPEKLNVTSDEKDKLKSNNSKGKKLKNITKHSDNKRKSVTEQDSILKKSKRKSVIEDDSILNERKNNSEVDQHYNLNEWESNSVDEKEFILKEWESNSVDEKEFILNEGQSNSVNEEKSILNEMESNSVVEEDHDLINIKIYNLKENNGVIFHMQHKSSFKFHGEIKITVLSGEIGILGYSLSHSSTKTSVDVYSPNFYTALVVETKCPKENKSKAEMEFVLQNYLSEMDMKNVLTDFTCNDTVLLITRINSVFGRVLNKYFHEPLFPKDLEDVSSEFKTIKSVQGAFNSRLLSRGKHFKKNPEWDLIPLGHCTVLCGGKGVGKSTLLQYYVNKTLAEGEKVLCLDFDVGQPEFTVSGCVSAVIVDQPLLGPNFTHLTDPVLMMPYGDVDVAQNPSTYLDCVKYVIESCKGNEEYLKMKWFVNTMGFSKGLGINIMTSIIKLLQPNTVIQIEGSHKKNYPFYLTSPEINSLPGLNSMHMENVQVSHELHIFKSYAGKGELGKKGELSEGALKPRQLRDLLILSYFSRMVSPPYYNFNAVQPYLIPFSQLYLGIHFFIEPNDILKAFNANLVTLMHFEPDLEEIFSVESEENDYFKIVLKPKLVPCFGFGFVRGIDVKEKKFYVMTHLPLETLNKVNCLCLNRLSPPHSIFLKQEAVMGQTFYTTTAAVGLVQRVKRVFHLPPKK